MGHAFESSLIDTLVRYKRMTGKNTLWLPGTDHASIAVQAILDRQLKAEKTDRYQLGREKFLERAWQWKEESGSTIVNQLRRLGVSVDWTRERFTMDEGLSHAVRTAFIKLYEDGLIYRGQYLVNWCPESRSAVSDLEVENKDIEGNLWYFRYPLDRDCRKSRRSLKEGQRVAQSSKFSFSASSLISRRPALIIGSTVKVIVAATAEIWAIFRPELLPSHHLPAGLVLSENSVL